MSGRPRTRPAARCRSHRAQLNRRSCPLRPRRVPHPSPTRAPGATFLVVPARPAFFLRSWRRRACSRGCSGPWCSGRISTWTRTSSARTPEAVARDDADRAARPRTSRPTTATKDLGRTCQACRCQVRSHCHGGFRVFHRQGPDLVGLLTRQRAFPCRPHAYERCPERARRCPRCPLDGPSASRFSARATILSRMRHQLRRLGQFLVLHLLELGLVLAFLCLMGLSAFLGMWVAHWLIGR